MATTPTYGWEYQTLADAPNGALLGENLALDIEATVAANAATESAARASADTTLQTQIDFLMNRPMARLRQTVAQSIPNTTLTALTFTTEDLDDDPAGTGAHDTGSNTSRYTAVYAGWYRLAGTFNFVSGGGTVRGSAWAVNGTLLNGGSTQEGHDAVTFASVARTMFAYLNIGDYVELKVNQDSGGALSTFITAEYQCSMDIEWVRNAA